MSEVAVSNAFPNPSAALSLAAAHNGETHAARCAAEYAFKIEGLVSGEQATPLSHTLQKYASVIDNAVLNTVFVASFVAGAEGRETDLVRSRHGKSRQMRSAFVQNSIDDALTAVEQLPDDVLATHFKPKISDEITPPVADKGLPPVFPDRPALKLEPTPQDLRRIAFQTALCDMGMLVTLAKQAGKDYATVSNGAASAKHYQHGS